MNKKSILLIGGGGYIGQVLCQFLKNEYSITYTNRKKITSCSHHRYLLLSDEESIKKVLKEKKYHFIIILASKISIKPKEKLNLKNSLFKENFFDLNMFLQAVTSYQKKAKLVYLSSMTVYDKNSDSPVTEQSFLNPIHSYGLSKLFAEQLFSFYVSHTDNKGVVMRLPGVWGGNKKNGFIFKTALKLKKNQVLKIDTKDLGFWETIHIDDLTEMIAEFLEKYKFTNDADIFNFGYGKEIDLIKTAFLIKKILKSKSQIKIKNKDYKKFFLSNKKLSKIINLKKYSFEKSLKKYIQKI